MRKVFVFLLGFVVFQSVYGQPGCEHYMRQCKLEAVCCEEWVSCRKCHDTEKDHRMDRYAVQKVQCQVCLHEQQLSSSCENCAVEFASYFCKICRLYGSFESDEIFHCDKCEECKFGVRENFTHCAECQQCIRKDIFDTHDCYLEVDCPVCLDHLRGCTISLLPCGHKLHGDCVKSLLQHRNYRCPTCQRSMVDMTKAFDRIRSYVANLVVPEPRCYWKAHIACRDCQKKSIVPYKVKYHECANELCRSFNTVVDSIEKPVTSESSDL